MEKYLVILKGTSEGCDYSLGCNMDIQEVEADSPQNAYRACLFNEDMGDPSHYYTEYGLEDVMVVKKSDVTSFDFKKVAIGLIAKEREEEMRKEEDQVLRQAAAIKARRGL